MCHSGLLTRVELIVLQQEMSRDCETAAYSVFLLSLCPLLHMVGVSPATTMLVPGGWGRVGLSTSPRLILDISLAVTGIAQIIGGKVRGRTNRS